jgi:hypothetical protein
MEENKFTKGKWTVAEFNKATVIAPHGDKGKNIIVAQCDINSLHGKGVDSDKRRESESNARLIAAAPDMYEALKDFVLWANIKMDHQVNTSEIRLLPLSLPSHRVNNMDNFIKPPVGLPMLTNLKRLIQYSGKYEINIQFWPLQTSVFIAKDNVDLENFGGDMHETIQRALEYLDRINRVTQAK